MSRYIPEFLRIEVAHLAAYRCEYCRRPEADSFIKYQIDHIISIKHGGLTVLENLAFSCPICNSNKGSDIGTILEDENQVIRLFHPRKQHWFDHFEVSEGLILPKTDVGAATIKLLNLNDVNRVLERLDLIQAGLFP
ncbi:MAG: HNH endonuclease [Saprospiraceae bacterium]